MLVFEWFGFLCFLRNDGLVLGFSGIGVDFGLKSYLFPGKGALEICVEGDSGGKAIAPCDFKSKAAHIRELPIEGDRTGVGGVEGGP